jgi:hypothetical protein
MWAAEATRWETETERAEMGFWVVSEGCHSLSV